MAGPSYPFAMSGYADGLRANRPMTVKVHRSMTGRDEETCMNGLRALVAGLVLVALPGLAGAAGVRPCTWIELKTLNVQLNGKVLDFTHNHGGDYRIWSWALCEKRDLYVYLPPCFN